MPDKSNGYDKTYHQASKAVANSVTQAKGNQMPAVKAVSAGGFTSFNPPGHQPVLQAVWEKQNDDLWKESALIDGVQWFRNAAGKLWYRIAGTITEGSEDAYRRWEGEKFTEDQWDLIELHASGSVKGKEDKVSPVRLDIGYLYKGVSPLRLRADFAEPYLPIGIRPGSATAKEMASSGRLPTDLDYVTVWFGTQDVGIDYCKKQSTSILLRINVTGHPIIVSEKSYFSTMPVAWSRLEYFTSAGMWAPIVKGTMPRNVKDFSEDDASGSDENEWSE